MPKTQMANNSGDRKNSTIGVTTGIMTPRMTAPISPPISDELKAAPKARPASPRLAIGYPSITVAAQPTVPGTPKRIAGITSP